jgi:hypothetical protein
MLPDDYRPFRRPDPWRGPNSIPGNIDPLPWPGDPTLFPDYRDEPGIRPWYLPPDPQDDPDLMPYVFEPDPVPWPDLLRPRPQIPIGTPNRPRPPLPPDLIKPGGGWGMPTMPEVKPGFNPWWILPFVSPLNPLTWPFYTSEMPGGQDIKY